MGSEVIWEVRHVPTVSGFEEEVVVVAWVEWKHEDGEVDDQKEDAGSTRSRSMSQRRPEAVGNVAPIEKPSSGQRTYFWEPYILERSKSELQIFVVGN